MVRATRGHRDRGPGPNDRGPDKAYKAGDVFAGDVSARKGTTKKESDEEGSAEKAFAERVPDVRVPSDLFDLYEQTRGGAPQLQSVERSTVFAVVRYGGHAAHTQRPSKALRPDDPVVFENDHHEELAARRAHETKVLRPPLVLCCFEKFVL